MAWGPERQVSAELRQVWVRQGLRTRQQRVSGELREMELREERRACRERVSSPIEPSPRE